MAQLNQKLEQRVADQVGEIERMSRLRRFLPPQVADLIVASGSEKQLESHLRYRWPSHLDLHTDPAAMLRVGNGPKRLKKFSQGQLAWAGQLKFTMKAEHFSLR
jgi:hypothetical protein